VTHLSAPVVDQDTLAELVPLLRLGNVAVLTGAGLSTESGIPDYRGPSGALRRQTPMTLQAFKSGDLARRRYWARSALGWRTIGDARPNAGHHCVAELERLGLVAGVITQNVEACTPPPARGLSSSCTAISPESSASTAERWCRGRPTRPGCAPPTATGRRR
jgi:hypothetical protein